MTKEKKRGKQNKRKIFADAFFRVCGEKFRFLNDEYDFNEAARESPHDQYYQIIYQNDTTAVKVYFEWRDMYVSVQTCRLVDGQFRENPLSWTMGTELTCYHIDDLVSVRAPEYDRSTFLLSGEARSIEDVVKEISACLESYVAALRAYGKDILRGDFSVFPQLDKIAKQRARDRGALNEYVTLPKNRTIEK